MSTTTKSASKGGKTPKGEKGHKPDKNESGKSTADKQQSGAGGDSVRSKDDPSIKEKVRQIVDLTHKPEEEVLYALHDCDNDVQAAINTLYEKNNIQDEWETTNKKKKNRQASTSKVENTETNVTEDWNDNTAHTEKEKSRNKSGGPPRLHGRHNDSRGWRAREKLENDRNTEEGGRSDFRSERRGRSGGNSRGGGSGRGRGGGRAGGRFPPRGNRGGTFGNKPIETWDNSNTWDNSTASNANHTEDNWDDLHTDEWSAEEYTGSLVETKVFTPSVQQVEQQQKEAQEAAKNDMTGSQQLSQNIQLQSTQMPSHSPVPMVGTLNQAQTQYLNQLTQQNSDSMKNQYSNTVPQNYSNASQSYNSAVVSQSGSQVYSANQQYGNPPSNVYVNSTYSSNTYGDQSTTQQPVRTKQRARVPPPSKIPSSAVEMPGETNSTMGFLDLQFGAMDIISDGATFDGVNDTSKFNTTGTNMDSSSSVVTSNLNVDLNSIQQQQTTTNLDYSGQKTTGQSSISSALTQSLTNTESIPQTSEHLTAPPPYNTSTRSTNQAVAPSQNSQGIEMGGNSSSKQAESHAYSQSSTYNSYQQPKSSSYQTQSYNSSSYSGTQTTSSSYVSNQASNNYTNNNTGSYNNPSGGNNSYQNTYSSNSSYQSGTNVTAFPSMTQANSSYPGGNSNQTTYQQNTSQSVYGLNNSSNYGNTTSGSAGQYNSYNTGNNHKLVKDTTYDGSTTASNSSSVTTTISSSTTSASLNLTQTTSTSTKSTTALAKNSNVVSNIPPGVTPVMSTPYIMGQGIPYFQQPIYSYEEMQMLQQRIPHMTTPFYEMSYQTPTTLAAVRDGALATYSMSDARFTRGDNNASPVPSTLSQQTTTLTAGHQAQPMLAQTAAGPYFFATPYNPMQASYQFGAVYSQLPAGTNAHGSSNSNQYPKPATYSTGYGSGYDQINHTQDYSKGGYVSNTQTQNKAGANVSTSGPTGNDLANMYGKSHTALGKVNSYEKQGFHSGTPPPFTGTLHGNQNAGLAPSGTGYGVFVPTMAPHQQHHSTPLMHQSLHQMEVRHQGRRMDSGNNTGQRNQASNQTKTGAKQGGYQTSYWNQA